MLMLALLAPLAMVGEADAAAYYFTDAGTRGMARGGAFIAGVNDLSAQYYNPAGLMNLSRGQAYINHSLVTQDIAFTRVDYDADGTVLETHPTVENIADPMHIPQFAVGHHFGMDDFMFAVGLHPPFAPDLEYPAAGAQRYSLQDSLVLQFYLGPSAAWQPTDWLKIGAGVYWSYVKADYGLSLLTCTSVEEAYACEDEPDTYDVDVFLTMEDTKRYTWNAGIIVDPIEQVSIGLSVLPPVKVSGKGSLTADFGEDHLIANFLDGTTFADQDVTVNLTMPLIIRSGVAVRPLEGLEVEAAAVYQRWSMTEEIRVTDIQLSLTANPDGLLDEDILLADDVVLPAGYQDMVSWRLGGEYDATDWLTVRAGGYYEPSAIPAPVQSVSLVDGKKWGFGLGGTYWFKDTFSVDLGYSRTQIAERDIRYSEVSHVLLPLDFAAVLAGEETGIEDGGVVGNGNIKTSSQYVSAGLTFYFGKERGGEEG